MDYSLFSLCVMFGWCMEVFAGEEGRFKDIENGEVKMNVSNENPILVIIVEKPWPDCFLPCACPPTTIANQCLPLSH